MPTRCGAPERTRVRRTIATLCDLREAQAEARRCTSKADRSLDLKAAYSKRDALLRRCDALTRRLEQIDVPQASTGLRRTVERNFTNGRLATPTEADEAQGIAVLGPGWRTAANKIAGLETIQRVLRYLEQSPKWRRGQLDTSPHPAIPRSVCGAHQVATLQNLPAWQSARLTLVACALANRRRGRRPVTAAELTAWVRSLGIHSAYVPTLRSLRTHVNR